MTQIKRLCASSGPEVVTETLQITIGSDVHYLCQGYEGITATTENGDTVTFTACAIDIALPARNADGMQDLKFALCSIDDVVSTMIHNALANRLPVSLMYRRYISTDLAAPTEVPYTLKIKSGSRTATEVQITAGYMNILDTAQPRYHYTLPVFPGLRYISQGIPMLNPDKYRSITWLKGGRAYPQLDCFGIVNEMRRDPNLPVWPDFVGVIKDDGGLDREVHRMVLTLERCESCEGAGVTCYSGSTVTHVGIVVSIDGLLHMAECNPGTNITFLPLPRFKRRFAKVEF